MRQMHPNRLRFAMFSDRNPMMQPVKALAESGARRRASRWRPTIRCSTMEQVASTWITTWWESYQQARDATDRGDVPRHLRLAAAAGHGRAGHRADRPRATHRPRPGARGRRGNDAQAELEQRFEVGGLPQAVLRAIIYVRMPERSVDERGFAALQAIRRHAAGQRPHEHRPS